MILPLQVKCLTLHSIWPKSNVTSLFIYLFIYLFIQIQILIGFQPNRFVTKYSPKKTPKFMEQIKSMLFVFRFLFIL